MSWTVWVLNPSRGKRFFSSPEHLDSLWSPFSLVFCGNYGSFPGVNQQELDVDCSPPPRSEVKNEWSCTSTLLTVLHGVHRGTLCFTNYGRLVHNDWWALWINKKIMTISYPFCDLGNGVSIYYAKYILCYDIMIFWDKLSLCLWYFCLTAFL